MAGKKAGKSKGLSHTVLLCATMSTHQLMESSQHPMGQADLYYHHL